MASIASDRASIEAKHRQNRVGPQCGPLTWKRRRRMASNGMLSESHCGCYRIYEFADGTFGAGHHGACWNPIERRADGLPRRYKTRAKAIEVASRHARQGGAA